MVFMVKNLKIKSLGLFFDQLIQKLPHSFRREIGYPQVLSL